MFESEGVELTAGAGDDEPEVEANPGMAQNSKRAEAIVFIIWLSTLFARRQAGWLSSFSVRLRFPFPATSIASGFGLPFDWRLPETGADLAHENPGVRSALSERVNCCIDAQSRIKCSTGEQNL